MAHGEGDRPPSTGTANPCSRSSEQTGSLRKVAHRMVTSSDGGTDYHVGAASPLRRLFCDPRVSHGVTPHTTNEHTTPVEKALRALHAAKLQIIRLKRVGVEEKTHDPAPAGGTSGTKNVGHQPPAVGGYPPAQRAVLKGVVLVEIQQKSGCQRIPLRITDWSTSVTRCTSRSCARVVLVQCAPCARGQAFTSSSALELFGSCSPSAPRRGGDET